MVEKSCSYFFVWMKNVENKNVQKHAAAYHVNRSAVKNVHEANKGIERARQQIPAKTNATGFRV